MSQIWFFKELHMISLSLLTDNQYTHRQALETQKKETLLVSNTYSNRTNKHDISLFYYGDFQSNGRQVNW